MVKQDIIAHCSQLVDLLQCHTLFTSDQGLGSNPGEQQNDYPKLAHLCVIKPIVAAYYS